MSTPPNLPPSESHIALAAAVALIAAATCAAWGLGLLVAALRVGP